MNAIAEPPVFVSGIAGEVIATGVSEETFLAEYADLRCEWVEGIVIQMSPVKLRHNFLILYLCDLFQAYFEFRPIAQLIPSPFLLRMPTIRPRANREPDLMILLNGNQGELTETSFTGAPDIIIEIVSLESSERDRGAKFVEYQKIGAGEYWLLDPLIDQSYFYRRDERGAFILQTLDADQHYRTPLLPDFALHVPTLWQTKLPTVEAILQAVKAMLAIDD